MNSRILLVEDDLTLSMIIKETLERNGFEVTAASDGEEGLRVFTRNGADAIVADVMMPRMSGFEMARRIRRTDKNVPLLFLTAKAGINDIVEGFDIGGNDYLKKPFKMMELIVRLKALLRHHISDEPTDYSIGRYTLLSDIQQLIFPGKNAIELSMIETRLLKELAKNIGVTVDAETLMLLIWQRDDPYSRNSLHGFIHKLRRYLRHDPEISIRNQRGIGYMLAVARSTAPD